MRKQSVPLVSDEWDYPETKEPGPASKETAYSAADWICEQDSMSVPSRS